MKISPVPTLGNTVGGVDTQGGMTNKVRALKMATNATPLGQEGVPNNIAPAQELSISDTNSNNESKAAVEATQPLSPQLAALAKQRRVLQQERRAFEEEKKAILAKATGSGSAIDLARLKQEPLSVLQEAGVTYDQLTEAILASQGNSEINSLKAEINALKEGVDKRFTEERTQSEQQALSEMRREAQRLIEGNDSYELVRETGSVPDVVRLIESVYRESGEILEVPEALKLVEDELFERNQKLAKLKKMQGLFNTQSEVQPQQRPQGMRTLTNKDTASVPQSAKARAIAAFYGTLKK